MGWGSIQIYGHSFGCPNYEAMHGKRTPPPPQKKKQKKLSLYIYIDIRI